MLGKRRFWIGLAVSLFFLFLFFYKTDFPEIWRSLRGAEYIYLLPAAVIYFAAVWFRALRWRYLLEPLGEFPASRLYPVVAIGYMANNLLPLRAGELVRAYIVGEKERISKTSVLATIVVERIFDGLTLLVFLAFIMMFADISGWFVHVAQVMSAVFLSAFVLFLLIVSSARRTQLAAVFAMRLLSRRAQAAGVRLVVMFIDGLRVLQRPWNLSLVTATSVAGWMCEAAIYVLVARAFHLGEPFYVLLLALCMANLAITLPSSQGGIGPFEYFARESLTRFNTSKAAATAYAIVLHAVLMVPVTVVGLFFLWRENISLGELERQRVEAVPLGGAVPLDAGGEE